jgi:hypothetical protein
MRPLLLLLLAPALAAACAHKAGREAAEGAVAGLREEEVTRLAGKAGHRLAAGIIDELAKKEGQQRLREIAGAAVTGAFEGATGVPPGRWVGPGGVGGAGAAPTYGAGLGGSGAVARGPARLLGREMGTGLVDSAAARLEQHLGGGGGRGPLATSLAATFQNLSSSVVRGAADEAARAFPECEGKDRVRCIKQHVEQVARGTGKHIAQGIVEGIGVWPFVIAFALGIAVTGLLVWVIAVTISLKRLRNDLRQQRQSRPPTSFTSTTSSSSF